MKARRSGIAGAAWVPGLPHLLHPNQSRSWEGLNKAYQLVGDRLRALKPDVIVIYSTQWLSVLGTSFQTAPRSQGVHVDDNWYALGDLPFDLKSDSELGETFASEISRYGLPTKTVNFESFPIDTGTIIAQQFLNPNADIPVSIVSSWVYADAEKSKLIGKTMRHLVERQGKRAFFVACSLMSGRYFTEDINPMEDKVSSPVDDAWNRKILGWLESGDFSTIEKESSTFAHESVPDMQFNAFHWLHGVLEGTHSKGWVLNYGPIWGTGASVIEFINEETP